MKCTLVVSLVFLMSCATVPESKKEHDGIGLLKTAAEGDPVEAVVQLNQTWRRARKLGHTDLEAKARATLATRILELGAPTAAIEHLEMALVEARKRRASAAVVDAAVLLTSAWIELGEIEAATRALDEAARESAAAKIDDPRIERLRALLPSLKPPMDPERTLAWQQDPRSGPRSVPGMSDELRDQLEQADVFLKEGLDFLREMDHSWLSDMAVAQGDPAAGLDAARDRLRQATASGDPKRMAAAHARLAALLGASGRLSEAASHWIQIRDMTPSPGEPWITMAHVGLATREIEKGSVDSAQRSLKGLEEVASDSAEIFLSATLSQLKRDYLDAVDKWRRYRETLGPELPDCTKTEQVSQHTAGEIQHAETNLAWALSSAGQHTEALRRARCAVDLGGHYLGRTIALEGLARAYLLSADGLVGESRKGHLLKAEALFELVLPQYRRWRTQLPLPNQIALLDAHSIPAEGLQWTRRLLGSPELALEGFEAARASGRLIEAGRPDEPWLADVQRIAKAQGVTFLIYSILHDPAAALVPDRFSGLDFRLEKALYIWGILPTGEIRFREVDLSKRTFTLEATVTAAIKSKGDDGWADELGSLLIEPVREWLSLPEADGRVPRLVLVSQGALQQIPFAALPFPQKNDPNAVLLDLFELLQAPSLTYYAQAAQRDPSARKDTLVVGVPTPWLAGPQEEALLVGKIHSTTPLLGPAASPEVLLRQLPTVRLFHFAGHSDGRSLQLDEGTDLGLEDILTLDLDLDLAVLATCDSARDRQVHSQSFDLARAFLLRGSRLVIASLWPMDDNASKIAMELFHSRLAADPDPIRALHQTALALRSQGKKVSDWAGFIVLGSSPHTKGGAG